MSQSLRDILFGKGRGDNAVSQEKEREQKAKDEAARQQKDEAARRQSEASKDLSRYARPDNRTQEERDKDAADFERMFPRRK